METKQNNESGKATLHPEVTSNNNIVIEIGGYGLSPTLYPNDKVLGTLIQDIDIASGIVCILDNNNKLEATRIISNEIAAKGVLITAKDRKGTEEQIQKSEIKKIWKLHTLISRVLY